MLKLLRAPESVRLWVGLCQDWDNEDNEDAIPTAKAAAATLAMSAQDPQVTVALVKEKVGEALVSLLASEDMELIHRALVCLCTIVEVEENAQMENKQREHQLKGGYTDDMKKVQERTAVKQLLEAGVAPALSALVEKVRNTRWEWYYTATEPNSMIEREYHNVRSFSVLRLGLVTRCPI